MHLNEFAHRADAAIAKMVDIVGLADSIVKANDLPNDFDQIFICENTLANFALGLAIIRMQPMVQLVATDTGQIISAIVEEKILEHLHRIVAGWGIPRAQATIQLDERLVLALGGFLIE